MVLWEYQVYLEPLLLAQKAQLKANNQAQEKATTRRFFYKTILKYDNPPKQIESSKQLVRQADLIEKYFRFNKKRLSKSSLSRSEFNYADIERIKMTRHMKYLSNYFLNKHLRNVDHTWLKDNELGDGFFLYEEYKLRTPVDLLKYKYRDIIKNEAFKNIMLRSHSIERVSGVERSEPN